MSYDDPKPATAATASGKSGTPVYKRVLDLFEAEGINTLFGIPDPNFVHMFLEAERRGWTVVAPIMKPLPASWPKPRRASPASRL